MQSVPVFSYTQRDNTPATPDARALLDEGYIKNMRQGKAPYAGVQIRTLGELSWILGERNWSGSPHPRMHGRIDLRDADLRGAQWQEAPLFGADLSHADCTGICLQRAVLSWANCQNILLQQSDLSAAQFSGADLQGADLRGAQLRDANLFGADLTGAQFADEDLVGAILRWADIDDAPLRRLQTQGADVFGANTYRQAAHAAFQS